LNQYPILFQYPYLIRYPILFQYPLLFRYPLLILRKYEDPGRGRHAWHRMVILMPNKPSMLPYGRQAHPIRKGTGP
jgi:hypothetical protein